MPDSNRGGPRDLLVKITCGAEDAERSNQGLTVSALAVAAGAEVSLWLAGEAVWYAVAGRDVDLALAGATPADELVATVLAGGRVTVCSQCAFRRELTEEHLLPDASIRGAAGFVEEALADGVQALVY